jgi:8-oxo-dGTP diphosphatase
VAQPTSDSPRPPIAAAVIVKDGRVLLVRRRVKEGSLSWQFPAGEMEEGELAGTAAVRETYEETGLTVADTNLLGERLHPATGRVMIYVACNVIEGEAKVVDNDELADFTWATGDQLAEYVPYGFYPVVQDYLDAELVR